MSFVTVVSGLPRSGTSLVMQMLVAGGMEPLADDHRLPDPNNPRGYLEYEPVKRTREDAAWVGLAAGKVVKVVHALLQHLPDGFEYRVVLAKRPIHEVLRSQDLMLARLGKPAGRMPSERLGEIFLQQMQQAEREISERPNFRVMSLEYHDCVYRPELATAALSRFLDLNLDIDAMCAAVDPALYRNRS